MKIEDKYLDFETSMKLHEIGFYQLCQSGYFLVNDLMYKTPCNDDTLFTHEKEFIMDVELCWYDTSVRRGTHYIYCPTVDDVLRWLRDYKLISINISRVPFTWQYEIVDINFERRFERFGKIMFNKYEDAAKDAIKYYIENLTNLKEPNEDLLFSK